MAKKFNLSNHISEFVCDCQKIHKDDVKEFIKIIEEIVTRRCKGTSANCHNIKKEIKDRAGDKLI